MTIQRNIGRVTISIDALDEDCPDLGWDDNGEVAADIDAGRLVLFCARIRVAFGPYKAETYLGNCVYHSLEEFVSNRDYYRDMVSEAIAELRATIKSAKVDADYWSTQLVK